MRKNGFGVDFDKLETRLLKKSYRLSDVKDQLETVSFDIVRFRSGDEASKLWQIQSAEDGDYIVTLYQEEDLEKTASPWQVSLSKIGKDLNFFYKGDPIAKIATSKFQIPENELPSVERYLPVKLASNKKLVGLLLNSLNETAKNLVLSKYPELKA
jgi:hypothetical protein